MFVSVVCYEFSIEMQKLDDTLIIDSMKRMLVCKVEWKPPGWMKMIGYLFGFSAILLEAGSDRI